jgi:purine-binding chemotaxis protein CheW
MEEPYILFKVADATYAIHSDLVQQVGMLENMTRIPNAPNFVEGVLYVRGKVVPIVNLRVRFGMEKAAYDVYSRLLVITLGNRSLGLAVDSAREFVYLDLDLVQPPPESLAGPGVEYLEGVYLMDDRLILLVNLARLFDPQERRQLETDFEHSSESANIEQEERSG